MPIMTDEMKQQLTQKILELLADLVGDEDQVFDALQPLVPIIINYGVSEGEFWVEELLDGLASDDTYPHWEALMSVSTHEERKQITSATRQAAIEKILKRERQDELRWTILKTAFSTAISIIAIFVV